MSSEKRQGDSQEGASMAASDAEIAAVQAQARFAPAKAARFIRRIFFFWTVGLGVLVTVLAMGEISARVFLYSLPDSAFKALASVSQDKDRPGLKWGFSFQPGFGIYPNPSFSENSDLHNSRGFRGGEVTVPKPEGTFRIACLGGSTTYDVRIKEYLNAYPAQLQSALRVRGVPADVVNAGCPAWTSREQILNYVMRVSYVEPDMIVYFEPINDLIHRAAWPPEKCRSDYTDPSVLVPEFAVPPWYMSLTMIRIPLVLSGLELPMHLNTSEWCDTFRHQGLGNIIGIPKRPGMRPSGIPAGMTVKDVFAAIPTDYYATNISSIIAFAKQRHTMVLLVSGMLNWKTIRDEWPDHGDGARYGVAQMNETLAKVAREQNVSYYDLAGEWPDDTSCWDEEIHNNEAGARLKAELIAKYIVKMNLTSVFH